ncbi:MAG: hypothetical protein J5756_02655, partial [Clostridia bacterium]|nr:hypothetical protein [Clostridia bacterium]MBR5769764.1 hypothetical protein [Clostridia bacterium]
NDVARFTRSDVMCSANVPKAHITREAHITSEGRITFRVSGTHRSPSVIKNTRRKRRDFFNEGAPHGAAAGNALLCPVYRTRNGIYSYTPTENAEIFIAGNPAADCY